MQKATLNQLTNGGHKSTPWEHLPQANQSMQNATIDQLTSGWA